MQFHVPKPLHGWRQFFGEIGVIVIGVLIAIGFGQVAEMFNWRAQVREARRRWPTTWIKAIVSSLTESLPTTASRGA